MEDPLLNVGRTMLWVADSDWVKSSMTGDSSASNAGKPDSLSSIPEAYVAEGKNGRLKAAF